MTENRMKRKKTGIIWLIFTIIWMSVIFSFSAKKAVESEGMSHSVGKEIGRLIVPQFTSWSEERQEQFAKMIDFPVRKCAHATEYAVLGVLILGTAYSFSEDSGKRSMLICWCAVQHMRQVTNYISCLCRAGAVSSEMYASIVPVYWREY